MSLAVVVWTVLYAINVEESDKSSVSDTPISDKSSVWVAGTDKCSFMTFIVVRLFLCTVNVTTPQENPPNPLCGLQKYGMWEGRGIENTAPLLPLCLRPPLLLSSPLRFDEMR